MKKIIDHFNTEKYTSKMFDMYFKDLTYAVFDIETTGLLPKYCSIILSGLITDNGDEFIATQFFANTIDDEEEIIRETVKILNSVDYIITYNGKHFDIPFLIKRASKYNIDTSNLPYNLDLYLIVNGYSTLKETIMHLNQKNVERYMGLSTTRADEISGGESVKIYKNYLTTHSKQLEEKILLHNHDDIIQLYRILPIINICDFHKAMYKFGFMAGNYQIDTIQIKGHDLYVHGLQLRTPQDYISFPTQEKPFSLIKDSKSREFELIIPGDCESGAIFIDMIAILGTDKIEAIKKYPSIENGYLITKNAKETNHMEINAFLKILLNEL